MDRPLVSVIIPLFNKERYIATTIESVIAQDYKNLELILINDGSTDNSLDVAHRLLVGCGARFKNVVSVSRKNSGMTETKNRGIALASGTYVAFLDADDLWLPDKISKQVEFLESNPEMQLVLCGHIMIFSQRFRSKCVSFNPINPKIKKWLMLTGYGGLLESTGLARKSALDEFAGFNPNLEGWAALDLAFSFSKNNQIGCVPEYLCGYRVLHDGWHNDKSDLVKSFNHLALHMHAYEHLVDEIYINLETYLRLWRLRNEKSLVAWRLLLVWLGAHPMLVIKFLALTLARVCRAQISMLLNWRTVSKIHNLAQR